MKDEIGRVEQQEEIEIRLEDVVERIGKMANWKASGPDVVRGFWFKKFRSLHVAITEGWGNVLRRGVCRIG